MPAWCRARQARPTNSKLVTENHALVALPLALIIQAMADLHAILEARRGDYARAQATLDTSEASVQQSIAKLQKIVAPWLTG